MKRNIVHFAIFTLTGIMTFGKTTLTSCAVGERWVQQNGIWYLEKEDGTYAVDWAQVDGKWYYFDGQGKMLSNWVMLSDNKWYYLNETTGAMETGWLYQNGSWYYLNQTTGAMETGWLYQNESWYYLNISTGAMETGWIVVDDQKYYLSDDGSMATGTMTIDGITYQFNSDGSYIGVQNSQDSYAEQVVALVNVERQKEGRAPIEIDESLMEVAQLRAEEIATVFSHTRPNGTSCFTAFEEAGITYYFAGENIAAGQRTPTQVVNSWMNSDGHRANILGGYTHIGVGFVKSNESKYTYYWVQCFINK